MPFVNMTPHALNVLPGNPDSLVQVLPPSGQSVRVAQSFEPVGTMEGVSLYRAVYGALETIDNATKAVVGGLPPVVEGTVYVVSGQALEAVKAATLALFGEARSDFAAPGELVRDDKGQPVGCNGLKVN